jgi:hypothetical protein
MTPAPIAILKALEIRSKAKASSKYTKPAPVPGLWRRIAYPMTLSKEKSIQPFVPQPDRLPLWNQRRLPATD